jgi:hypothetical protein
VDDIRRIVESLSRVQEVIEVECISTFYIVCKTLLVHALPPKVEGGWSGFSALEPPSFLNNA